MIAVAASMPDGVRSITLRDPATGASSAMANVVTYGAGPNDTIKLIDGSNPATPVGGQAPRPIRVQVLAPDGTTPVSGASVFFTSTPAVSYSACGGAGSCTLLTDESGQASSRVTVLQAAIINISVLLAPASYKTPKSVQATLLGVSSAMDISLLSPFAWIAQGATVDVALSARLLSNGAPVGGNTVNYQVVKGTGTLSSASAVADVNGFANSTLHIAAIAGDVQVSACVAPANKPCQIFSATAVPASALRLQPVAGSTQILPVGQSFQPVAVRVTDSATPVVSRPAPAPPPVSVGGIIVTRNPAPIIVSALQISVLSDAAGLATFQPSTGAAQEAIVIQGTSAAGTSSLPFRLQSLAPVVQAAPSTPSPMEGGSLKNSDGVRPRPQTTSSRH